ncbi:MAG: hypothetical protein K2M19_08285 [Muribaculaceae bacterium]|nr:hypothetical protein [Muribaculaceae bacterium]
MNKKDPKGGYATGDILDFMNTIRKELNDQGYNFGQRYTYEAIEYQKKSSVIPFKKGMEPALNAGHELKKDDMYVITPK